MWGSNGKIKFCKIHDLLRDFCLREAQREKFICVPRECSPNILQCINIKRRIVVHPSTSNEEYSHQLLGGLRSTSAVRSLICDFQGHLPLVTCRLLRVCEAANLQLYTGKSGKEEHSIRAIFQLVNLRHLAFTTESYMKLKFPSSMCLLWNLQTLVVKGIHKLAVAPSEIWQMPQLKHLQLFKLYLPDPPSAEEDKPVFVLRNLQTLFEIRNFKCGEDVVKRIPNIKKLQIFYNGIDRRSRKYCLNSLGLLHKLESLSCVFDLYQMSSQSYMVQSLSFPYSLMKLTLYGCCFDWAEMSIKIGSLPFLQVLKLLKQTCRGPEWKPVEGQFCSLKYLLIDECFDLECWTADETNFPRLEQLVLKYLDNLKEVPSSIGDIPTLKAIVLSFCSNSAVISAKKIVDEQEELGNVDLQVHVLVQTKDETLKSLESRNFQVEEAWPFKRTLEM